VWVTKADVARISKYLGRTDARLDKSQLRRIGLRHSLTEKTDGDCIFLKRQGGKALCSIYPVRPLQCQTWPFWSDLLRSEDTWNSAAATCPGMNHGQHHDFVAIEAVRLRKS